MVNKVTFVGLRGGVRPNRFPLDPPVRLGYIQRFTLVFILCLIL